MKSLTYQQQTEWVGYNTFNFLIEDYENHLQNVLQIDYQISLNTTEEFI